MTAAPPARSLALTRRGLLEGSQQYHRRPPKSLPRANSAYVGDGVGKEEGMVIAFTETKYRKKSQHCEHEK